MKKFLVFLGIGLIILLLTGCTQPQQFQCWDGSWVSDKTKCPEQIKDCGIIMGNNVPTDEVVFSCFENAFKKCEKAKMMITDENAFLNFEGYLEMVIEIQEKTEVPNVCKVFFKLQKLEKGNQDEKKFVGKTMTCYLDNKNYFSLSGAREKCEGDLKDAFFEPTQIKTNTCTGFGKILIKRHFVSEEELTLELDNMIGTIKEAEFTLIGKVGKYGLVNQNIKLERDIEEREFTQIIPLGVIAGTGEEYNFAIKLEYLDADGFSRTAVAECEGIVP